MKEWLTAREIAAEKLPALPETERGVQAFAERRGWNEALTLARPRAGRGGGLEYHVSLLPAEARIVLETRHRKIEAAPPPPAPAPVVPATDRAQREQAARLAVVAAADAFRRGQRLAAVTCDHLFVQKFNARELRTEDWILDVLPRISERSLARWRAAREAGRTGTLAVERGHRRGKGLLETANGGAVSAFILGWIAANPHLSVQVIRGYVEHEFGSELVSETGELVPLPPLRTFQHVIAKLKAEKAVPLMALTNPDAYRSTRKLRGTGSHGWVQEPNQLWQIDASPVDALCTDGRWTLYAAIDVATRRVQITLSRTPRASAVCLMLRKAILAWGVPRTIKTDNGSDFAAAETQRLFAALDIDPDPSDAYCPDQKPYVERVIGTFQHEVGPQLPGFIGHSVADRKAIEERQSFAARLGSDDTKTFAVQLTADQLQQHIDDWLEYVYHRRDHGTLGVSPAERARASTRPIARVDERALDVLLMPAADKGGRRKMTAQGISVADHYYLTHSVMVGTEVFVRLDPANMGRIYVFDARDGRFLSIAECPALLDVDRPAFVKATKQLYEAMVAEATKPIRAEKRRILKGPSGIERTIALAKAKAGVEAAANANVVPMPPRETRHTTPAIEAALEAVAPRTSAPKALSPRAAELHAAMRAEASAPTATENVRPLRTQETRQQRFRRALDLEARRAAGDPLTEQEAYWLGGYSAGSEYRAMRALYEDGGEKVLR